MTNTIVGRRKCIENGRRMGGDASDDLIDDVEAEEQGMQEDEESM
jgi:hypothetical protein